MKITPELLEKQWKNINYADGGYLQVDIEHPLEWYVGYISISQRALLLICDVDIGVIDSSKSIKVSRSKRNTDNRWTLSLELIRNEQKEVFAILCCDIIEHSRIAKSEKDALILVIKRYKQWSKLLETQRNYLMDENRRKGLLGELLFLEHRICIMQSVLEAVQGWSGPDGADQDFMYTDGWFEVKSIGVSASSIKISSLQQLDCSDEGKLVVKRIDKVAPDRDGAFSLNEVVYRISETVKDNETAQVLFQTKLTSYGYMDLQEYSIQKYLCTGTQIYHVDETFPRLTSLSVPSQVESA